jgi:hypothetical protein
MPTPTSYVLTEEQKKIAPWKWDDHYDFPRDLIGYGEKSLDPKWPNGAKIAVSFVINYEEGAEYTVLNGDVHTETHLWEASGTNVPILFYSRSYWLFTP